MSSSLACSIASTISLSTLSTVLSLEISMHVRQLFGATLHQFVTGNNYRYGLQ